jgi:hypothetical protein
MASLNVGTNDQQTYVNTLKSDQRICVYNSVPWTGYQDLADPSMNMYYDWQWRSKTNYVTPPSNYQIPKLPADTGIRVRIKSLANNQFMSASLESGAWIYNKSGPPPLDFIQVGPRSNAVFRATWDPDLFLSYTAGTGAVELYAPGFLEPSNYQVNPAGAGFSIMSIPWGPSLGYMNLNSSTQSPYVNGSGNPPSQLKSQWQFLPTP